MSSTIQDRLLALSPTAFENLVFDLIRSEAMENVAWRTPGADGGRDIEGLVSVRDFSGSVERFTWLIECKRYSSTVGWPTVWEKVAYADAAQADFLLMISTSKFSTRCLDEINKWNSLCRKPAIRVWPRHELVFRVMLKPQIAAKYGLIDSKVASASDLAGLALHVSRMTQSAMASEPSSPGGVRHAKAAAAIASLMYTRASDLESGRGFSRTVLWPIESIGPYVGESPPLAICCCPLKA